MMKKFAKYMPMSGFPAKKGQALQISITEYKSDGKPDSPPTVRLFVEFAPQVKDKPASGSSESPFDWAKKIFISLKEEEVGLLLATLRGRVQSGQVIHKFPIDAPEDTQKTSTLNVKSGEYNGETNYQISLRQKVGLGESISYAIYLQPAEAEIVIVILEECIRRMYRLD
jgi:hypothetical protein